MDAQTILRAIFGMAKASTGAPSEVLAEPPDQLSSTQHTFTFQRATYRRLLKTAFAQSIIISLLLITGIVLVLTADPQDRFFVASVDGRIDRIMPLDSPLHDNNQIFSFTGNTVAEAMTFGFLDYDQRKIEVGASFNDKVVDKIQNLVMGQGGVETLRSKALVFQASVDVTQGGGVLKQHINDKHIYEWVIAVPIKLITTSGYEGTAATATPWMVTLLVQRAAAVEKRNGVIIADVLAAQATGAAKPYQLTAGDVK